MRLTSLRGAGGEVVVVTAQNLRDSAAAETMATGLVDREMLERAAVLRPRGGAVDVMVPVRRGSVIVAQTVRVQPAAVAAGD